MPNYAATELTMIRAPRTAGNSVPPNGNRRAARWYLNFIFCQQAFSHIVIVIIGRPMLVEGLGYVQLLCFLISQIAESHPVLVKSIPEVGWHQN